MQNYNRFYGEGWQELSPFHMYILYGNTCCADSPQVLRVRK